VGQGGRIGIGARLEADRVVVRVESEPGRTSFVVSLLPERLA